MSYFDGCVLAVPTGKRDAYIRHSGTMAAILREHGAMEIIDAWGDDVPDGETTSFPMAVKKKPDETVVFSYIVWPDRKTRDAAWQAIHSDPRMSDENNPMPFDGSRMIFGGFVPVL